jgi:hypothetical protein
VRSGLAGTVADIVGRATLPAGSGARTADFGVLTAVTGTGADVSIVLDRETPYSVWNDPGMVIDGNDNPRTYPLRLAPGATIRSILGLCGFDRGITGGDNALGNAPCTPAQLTAAVRSGPRGPVWIKYDARGRVASIYEVYRP